MTCPLGRCDGSGWRVGGTMFTGPQLEPCPCHGWRIITRDLPLILPHFVLHRGRMKAAALDIDGQWHELGRRGPMIPQPTHYHPRPLPPEFGEETR